MKDGPQPGPSVRGGLRRLLNLVAGAVLLLASAACAGGSPGGPGDRLDGSASIWTADFIRTKPGQQERYLAYVAANWARARQVVLESGDIVSYRVLVNPATTDASWDVILLTEFPDSATYARREEIFGPVLERQGQTLIDGLSGSGRDNPLKTTVLSTTLQSPIGAP